MRSLTRRKFIQQDVCLCCGRLSFNTRSRVATVDGQTLALTRKESGVLEYLLLHQGRPVSQEELIEHVWDGSVDSFSNSIRVHISALRKKLRAALGYDPIRNRIGEGYEMEARHNEAFIPAMAHHPADGAAHRLRLRVHESAFVRTGVTGMDALNGFMMQYQPGSADSLTIEIPEEEMSSLLAHFHRKSTMQRWFLAARAGVSLPWSPSSAQPSLILSAAER